MTVLIYGVHKESEPWANDIAREVLSRNSYITPVECPDNIRKKTDWIPVFNQYVTGLRDGSIKRPDVLWRAYQIFRMKFMGQFIGG